MWPLNSSRLLSIAIFLAITACDVDHVPSSIRPLSPLSTELRAEGNWSEPRDAGVGSGISPALSPDGLSLYFSWNASGGFGGFDIWVARRESKCSAFGAPVNLGAIINTTEREQGAFISHDGHLLFFMRGNAGLTSGDIYVSRRIDVRDDFAWEIPVPLDPDVNTAQLETEPWFIRAGSDEGFGLLYFGRGSNNNSQDFYVAAVAADGRTRGPAVAVAELNSANVPPLGNEDGISVSKNGREAIFASRRFATGAAELFMSTRGSVDAPWGPPQLIAELNSIRPELHPAVSDDGRSLVFSSVRTGEFRLYLTQRGRREADLRSCD